MKKTDETNTAIYIRVSTEEQAREGYSINAQKEKLKQYAFVRGWDIYDFYIDDGVSAKNVEGRPEVLRMIKDVNKGKVNNVLVYKIDRLTRSTRNLIDFIDLFDKRSCSFNSITEAIDTSTATGRMFIKIVGIFAEFERENLAERVSFGYEQKANEGNYINSKGVYGFDYIQGNGGDLIVNEEEAQMIKNIYDWYLKGNSFSGICRKLDKMKTPTKRGGQWYSSTIRSILTNPLYIGKVRYGVMKDIKTAKIIDSTRYEKILDEETFYRVQEVIKDRKINMTKKYPSSNAYFLTFLRCHNCGISLSTYQRKNPNNGKAYVSYFCSYRKYNRCDSYYISQPKLEAAFQSYISEINLDIDYNINRDNEEYNLQSQQKKEHLEKEIGKVDIRLEDIRKMFMLDKITLDEYRTFSVGLNEKKENLIDELEKIEFHHDKIDLNIVKNIVTNLKTNWVNLTVDEKREFLTKYIKEIKINAQKDNVKVTEILFNNISGGNKPKETGLCKIL